MLSQNKVVDYHRKALELMYQGKCTIVVQRTVQKANKATGTEEETVCKDQPCRLSYSSFPTSTPGDGILKVNQLVKLFLAPEIEVPAGAKISVTQSGRTEVYFRGSQPAVYDTHQEINLETDRGWGK